MIISIASGKGGTGKTFIATNLAVSFQTGCQLLDCDVEEPNVHLFLNCNIQKEEKVFKLIPVVDKDKCRLCGKCQEVCAYHAIAVVGQKHLVFSELCHGCGACQYFCPYGAIQEEKKEIGKILIGQKNRIQLISGRLNIGEAMAPPVIRAVKRHIQKGKITIIDAPPGTSCPVIESVKDSTFSILVTEPTPFGLNDLKLGVAVLRKLQIPFGVVINRDGLGNKETESYCQNEGIEILLKIPFDRMIAEHYAQGKIVVQESQSYKKMFETLQKKIIENASHETNFSY